MNYDKDVSRFEYKHFFPVSTLHLNTQNQETKFIIPLDNGFISKNILYVIQEEYKPADASKSYNNESGIKMTDNFVAHLFTQIQVRQHGTLIDEIRFPGIPSTVKRCVEYPGPDVSNDEARLCGFKSKMHEGFNFEAIGKLGDLGLGVFDDIDILIYKSGLEIIFTTNNGNNVLFRWKITKADKTEDLPSEGKIEIINFYLKMPIIEYNREAKVKPVDELYKIIISFN